ncbi:uncharacterized protein [Nicotiana tomentosiformis]|uniref:uncharacterized protein n=1 Tax=Nicotiana tomentosiformis TaxID=4098 RepID=UPI00388CB97E
MDKQFWRFMDVLKQVHVNLPFIEVLSQMSAYAKFMKEVLTKKRKIEETSVLADQMTLIPEEIVEDVLVRVDKFIFPVNFIVVNMEENKEVPLILGRPFLEKGRAILDINESKLMLRMGEDTVMFDMNVDKGTQKEKPAASVK